MTKRHRHTWKPDPSVGCKENPGYFAGHGSIIMHSVCACGAFKREERYHDPTRARYENNAQIFDAHDRCVWRKGKV